jgi:hypothetical protein
MVYLYLAVAAGAFIGMIWPVVVILIKKYRPNIGLGPVLDSALGEFHVLGGTQNRIGNVLIWVGLCVFVAGVVTGLNIVPLVTGDNADKLKELDGWQYFFLAAEGFALAAAFEEGLRK